MIATVPLSDVDFISPPTLHLDVAPLLIVLNQLSELLTGLGDDEFTQKPVGIVPSSIGGHVRHCLDHLESLWTAVNTGFLEYDHRQRETTVERDRKAALNALAHLQERFVKEMLPKATQPLRLRILLDAAGTPVEVETTVGREVAFVLSHTIHHNALIAVQVKLLGRETPPRFGYAPSTIAHQEQLPCVR